MVGKYTDLSDAYLSVNKALQHACLTASRKLKLEWIEAGFLEDDAKATDPSEHESAWSRVRAADGILVPGGFGGRGTEGKILAAKYARENNKPYLGICLGMQIAVIEFARNVLGWENANSAEIDPATPTPVVVFMPEGSKTHLGGTMRLGTRRTILQTVDCIAAKLYQAEQYIDERHRHRYEVNRSWCHSWRRPASGSSERMRPARGWKSSSSPDTGTTWPRNSIPSSSPGRSGHPLSSWD